MGDPTLTLIKKFPKPLRPIGAILVVCLAVPVAIYKAVVRD